MSARGPPRFVPQFYVRATHLVCVASNEFQDWPDSMRYIEETNRQGIRQVEFFHTFLPPISLPVHFAREKSYDFVRVERLRELSRIFFGTIQAIKRGGGPGRPASSDPLSGMSGQPDGCWPTYLSRWKEKSSGKNTKK